MASGSIDSRSSSPGISGMAIGFRILGFRSIHRHCCKGMSGALLHINTVAVNLAVGRVPFVMSQSLLNADIVLKASSG